MNPSKREIDAALRSLEADLELARMMDSAARGAHESRRIKWQAEADECINRARSEQHDCDSCPWVRSSSARSDQLAAVEDAMLRWTRRTFALEVKISNHRLVIVILLCAVLVLVVLRWF